jgi:hypothetical protein
MRLEQAAAGYRLTAQCSRRAAVCWTGAEAPPSTFVRRRHGSCRSLLPMQLLGAATAAPRRSVARGGRAQLIGRSVGRTKVLKTRRRYSASVRRRARVATPFAIKRVFLRGARARTTS